jgi:F-type H+-transporting ATPase subunit delta
VATEGQIDGYAAAFIEFAQAENQLETISDELFSIARAYESSSELQETLTDPRLPVDRKQAIITELLGSRVSALTLNLVNFVISLGKARDLPAIADRLAQRAASARQKVVAEVRTAIELDDETVKQLELKLGAVTGKNVEAKLVVDPSVLGGIVAKVGDTVIDGSVKGRLADLKEQFGRLAHG